MYNTIKIFTANVAKILMEQIYNLTGKNNIILTLIIIALLVQLFNCLITNIRKVISYKLTTDSKSKIFKCVNSGLGVFEFVLSLAVFAGVYFVVANVGNYLKLSPTDTKLLSSTVAAKGAYIYTILVVASQGLSTVIDSIEAKKNGGKVSKVNYGLTVYIMIVLGCASYNLPIGMSIYWIAKTIASILITKPINTIISKKINKSLKDKISNNPEKYSEFLSKQKESSYYNKVNRFTTAQNNRYLPMLNNLQKGIKVEDELYYVFPISKELESDELKSYGMENIYEARAYLKNIVLGKRIKDSTNEILKYNNIEDILSENNIERFKSSITLFEYAATKNKDKELFKKALDKFFNGERCEKTLESLKNQKEKKNTENKDIVKNIVTEG